MSKALATKNVAAVLLGIGMILSVFAFATPANAQSMSDLQAQINALLAQIAALQAPGQQVGGASCSTTFTQNLKLGSKGAEVMALQKFLNSIDGTQLGTTGAGSPGNETSTFGPATKRSVIKFQEKYAADILTPVGLSKGTGNWFASTRAKANTLCAAGPGPVTPGPVTPGTLSVGAASQPANSLAPEGASRVPFTTFTLTNSSGSTVSVTGVTVQRVGLGDNSNFAGIVLVDETGMQIGSSKTLNSNNQVVAGDTFSINPGQTKTITVAGNMATDNSTRAGQVVSLQVVGINTTATVSGSLPISGANHTINATLDIGTLPVTLGPSDLDSAQTNQSIGETGKIGASIRLQAGSAEDVWVKSIRWNQSGSAASSDIANVVTVIDGTSYPSTVSADGKYYTAVFPGNGIQIQKGLTKEVVLKFDIASGPNRTVNFDLYRATDIYAVGGTFGYGITPTQSESGTASTASEFTAGTPFFSGSTFTISAGSVTSLSRANEVPAQNIVEVTPNQVLGGFAMDVKGEAISVQSMVFTFDVTSSTADAADLTNVTLVNENGAVVAGPVNGVAAGAKVTFSDTVTFGTGRHVYTVKGQLGSDFANNDTVQASTTPNDNWSTVTGQTSGDSISLTALSSAVTGNVMTVKAGAVAVSVNSTPASQTIVAGVSGLTVGSIKLDATQSGEDVRFTSIKALMTQGSLGTGEDPTNCFIYDGATRLNNTAVQPTTTATDYTFTLDTTVTVTKGGSKNLDIKCDIPASADGTFSWGITSTATFTGTGVSSSQSITPTVVTGSTLTGNTMTITSSGGTLTVSEDSSSPSYRIVAGNTADVTIGVLRLDATNEALLLDRVGLELSGLAATSTPDDVTEVTIWDGGTKVGTGFFSAGNRFATTTVTGVTVPANSFKLLTVKASLAEIGPSLSATTSGKLIQIDYDAGSSVSAGGCATRAVGASSGQQICSTSASDTSFDGVRVMRSYPTLAQLSIPSTVLVAGNAKDLTRFSVAASAGSLGVGIYKFTINVASSSPSAVSGTTTVENFDIYAYTDAAFSNTVAGYTDGLVYDGTDGESIGASTGDKDAVLSSVLQIPAGATYYFKVVGDVTLTSGSGTFSGNVTTKVLGDSAFPVNAATLMGVATGVDGDANDDFIWSPNSTTTSASSNVDWTNGYSVSGLPSSGLTGSTLSK